MDAQRRRVRSLDGLRGVAALAVVVSHIQLADDHIVRYSPSMFAVWAGRDAVTVFFVLSGVVLALAMMGRGDWGGYYLSRFVRLYLPAWGAIVFGALLHVAVGWHLTGGVWLDSHVGQVTPMMGVVTGSLVGHAIPSVYLGAL